MESWHATSLEAKALRGELNYQMNDMSQAQESFDESLDASVQGLVEGAEGEVVAFDLYRTAELALRRGDRAKARRSLEILVGRFPSSDWARKASSALARLDELERAPTASRRKAGSDEIPAAGRDPFGDPGKPPRRARRRALAACGRFLAKFDDHASAPEILLLPRRAPAQGGRESRLRREPALRGPRRRRGRRSRLSSGRSRNQKESSVERLIPKPAAARQLGPCAASSGAAWPPTRPATPPPRARAYRFVLQVPGQFPAKAYAHAALGRAEQGRTAREGPGAFRGRFRAGQGRRAGNLDGYLAGSGHGRQTPATPPARWPPTPISSGPRPPIPCGTRPCSTSAWP